MKEMEINILIKSQGLIAPPTSHEWLSFLILNWNTFADHYDSSLKKPLIKFKVKMK